MLRTKNIAVLLVCVIALSAAQPVFAFVPGGCMRGPDNEPLFNRNMERIKSYARISEDVAGTVNSIVRLYPDAIPKIAYIIDCPLTFNEIIKGAFISMLTPISYREYRHKKILEKYRAQIICEMIPLPASPWSDFIRLFKSMKLR